jgi:hypothetical protein
MTLDSNRFARRPIEELPNRIEHRRKIAERLAMDGREYGADDPSRTVDRAGSGYSAHGPGASLPSSSGRGPRTT